jgi:hypothetical protein
MDFEIIGEIRNIEPIARGRKTTRASHFAVCINNEGYKAPLGVGKLYRVIPDQEAASHGYVRVVDESGEDYGYAADRFSPLKVLKRWQRHYRELGRASNKVG